MNKVWASDRNWTEGLLHNGTRTLGQIAQTEESSLSINPALVHGRAGKGQRAVFRDNPEVDIGRLRLESPSLDRRKDLIWRPGEERPERPVQVCCCMCHGGAVPCDPLSLVRFSELTVSVVCERLDHRQVLDVHHCGAVIEEAQNALLPVEEVRQFSGQEAIPSGVDRLRVGWAASLDFPPRVPHLPFNGKEEHVE